MKIADMNWMQVEDYLRHDDRAVVPLGSTEQHAYLSLAVDSILSERVAIEAAEPLHVPVFPVLAYGITPLFQAYPGTVSMKMSTYTAIVIDLLDSLHHAGFRRILLCNGHGGNLPAQTVSIEWMAAHPGAHVRFHNWWNAPKTFARVQEIDRVASHASWMENFPWTRLANLKLPEQQKRMVDLDRLRTLDPVGVREYLGDGNFGGFYEKSDEAMLSIWQVAVEETRYMIEAWA